MDKIVATYTVKITLREQPLPDEQEPGDPPTLALLEGWIERTIEDWTLFTANATAERTDS